MKTNIVLALALVAIAATEKSFCQGVIIAEHSGASDPTSEGFALDGQGVVGPVFNDMGANAWIMQTTNGSPLNYSYLLTPLQQTEISSASWDLSVTVRLVQSSLSGGVQFNVGPEGAFFLYFGVDANGDPTVGVSSGSLMPAFVLTDAGSTYNNYQLLYDAANGSASLLVNGVEVSDKIMGDLNYASSYWGVSWGEYQSSYGMQANWNLVSLEIVPEPSSAAVLLLGGGVLILLRRKRRR